MIYLSYCIVCGGPCPSNCETCSPECTKMAEWHDTTAQAGAWAIYEERKRAREARRQARTLPNWERLTRAGIAGASVFLLVLLAASFLPHNPKHIAIGGGYVLAWLAARRVWRQKVQLLPDRSKGVLLPEPGV